jgi:O-antigen ligase
VSGAAPFALPSSLAPLVPWVAPLLVLLALGLLIALRRPLAALAGYAAVVPFGSSVPVPGPPPLDDLSSLAGAAVIAGLAVRLAASLRPALPVRPQTALWTLLLAVAALTALWSGAPARTLLGVTVLASLVLLYALVAATPARLADLHTVEAGIVLGGALVGCYAVYLAVTGQLAHVVEQRFVAAPGGSETGPAADPNVTAAALLLPCLLAVATAFGSGRVLVRLTALLAAAVTVTAIFLTGSRGGLLALLVGLLVLLALSPHRRRALLALAVPAVGVAVAVAVAVAPASVTERVSSDSRSSGRSDIWRIAVLSCPEHCLQGSGWSTFPLVHEDRLLSDPAARGVQWRFEAHNVWLSALVEGGVAALVLLTAALVVTARRLWRLPQALRAPPLAALAALLVANGFLSTLPFKYFWLVLVHAALVESASSEAPGSTSVPARPRLHERAIA